MSYTAPLAGYPPIQLSQLAALVASFNSRTGNVVPKSGDYTAGDVGAIAQGSGPGTGLPAASIKTYAASTDPAYQLTGFPLPLSNLAALVASFNGRTGAVVPESGDYTAADVGAIAQGSSPGSGLPAANESEYVANDNTGNIAKIIGADTSSTVIPLTKLAALVASFNGRTGAVVPESGDYTASDVGALPVQSIVNSFNGRTGAVVPAAGDYINYSMGGSAATSASGATINTGLSVKAGPNGVVIAIVLAVCSSIDQPILEMTAGNANINWGISSQSSLTTDLWQVASRTLGQTGTNGYPSTSFAAWTGLTPGSSQSLNIAMNPGNQNYGYAVLLLGL